MSIVRAMSRRWHFARQIPPAQIVARLRLKLRRALEERVRPSRGRVGVHLLAALLPLPVFAPRESAVSRDGDGWRFAFLGRQVAMAEGIAWHGGEDPATQLWRMNLHYMEWLEALDGDSGRAAIRDWIAANLPYTRRSWGDAWNSYALSLRVVCWLQFLARHPGDSNRDIATSVAEQLAFLTRHLETDIGGNHLIKNIKALLWGAACIDGPGREAWLDTGRRLLADQIDRQILGDGTHFELSPSYHAQVFADLIECHHALAHLGLDSGLAKTLAAMAGATVSLTHPDGGPALFNDAGLTMACPPTDCLNAYIRLIGLSVPEQHGAFALPDAGYFGLRTATVFLIAKMGSIGPDVLPAHAHADIGSFELSLGGLRMIVDQGVFEYVEGAKRTQSRATACHNTVALGDRSQADLFGSFRVGLRPPPPEVVFESKTDGLSLEGRWQGAFDGGAHVTRRIEADSDRIIITDRIDGGFAAPATSALLLHPACVVRCGDRTATITRDGASITLTSSLPIVAEHAVWWPDMGQEIATTRLRLTFPNDCRESALEIRIAGA